MSGKHTTSQFLLGNGGLVANGRVAGLFFPDGGEIILVKRPSILQSSITVEHDYIEHFCRLNSFGNKYLTSTRFRMEISLEGYEGEFLHEVEPGFIQRMMTEDITTGQMIRLVREKIEKRKI